MTDPSPAAPPSVRDRINKLLIIADPTLTPPLPSKISIEINNGCNHFCYFCPNPTMARRRTVMAPELVLRVLGEAWQNGVREVSFYSTGEPFLVAQLPRYIAAAKALGFSYVFLSTNGGKATTARIEPTLDAGLDSLKFSINAGTRESYALVHGVDEFEQVMANVQMVADYRARTGRALRLVVSYVDTPLSRNDFGRLQERIGHLVDEIVRYPFMVIGTPLSRRTDAKGTERPFIGYEDTNRREGWNVARLKLPCYQLWNYLNVTVEGHISACCADFNNDLIVGSLASMSLMDAWHSPEFQKLRQMHVDRRIKGTLCHSCIAQKPFPYEPLNQHLTGAATR